MCKLLRLHRFFWVLVFSFPPSYLTAATWNLNANGNWNVNGNWTAPAVFPNAIDGTANFLTVITNNRTITLGQNITIGTIAIDDNNNYNIQGANCNGWPKLDRK